MSKKHKSAIASMLAQLKENSSDLDSSVKQLSTAKESTDNNALGFLDKIDYYGAKKSHIIEVETDNCILWKYKDRSQIDLGNIEELAKDIEAYGQVVPGIIRISESNQKKYEIIAGERRWRACKLLGIKFKAILEILSDKEAAVVQAAENLNRKDLSDYSKGLNYHNLIESGVFTQSELAKKLNISKANMSNLLSFADIPQEYISLLPDVSKVSARTATEIRAVYNKGGKFSKALRQVLPMLPISSGANKLTLLLNKELNGDSPKNLARKVYSKNDSLLFTLRSDGKRIVGISFPATVTNKIDEEKLCSSIKNYLETVTQ